MVTFGQTNNGAVRRSGAGSQSDLVHYLKPFTSIFFLKHCKLFSPRFVVILKSDAMLGIIHLSSDGNRKLKSQRPGGRSCDMELVI